MPLTYKLALLYMKTERKTKIDQSNENRKIIKKELFLKMSHLDSRYHTERVKYREVRRLDI